MKSIDLDFRDDLLEVQNSNVCIEMVSVNSHTSFYKRYKYKEVADAITLIELMNRKYILCNLQDLSGGAHTCWNGS